MVSTTPGRLETIAARLAEPGPAAAPPVLEALALVFWEQVAYLADDERRLAAFRLLEESVGLSAKEVAAADKAILVEIAARGGGTAIETRAARMKDSARLVLDRWDGDLGGVLDLPVPKALRELARFPMIGKPGAEKILLLCRAAPLLALDSNALRVLLRLGYGEEDANYDRCYRSVRAATAAEERVDLDWLFALSLDLRRHGREVCRRTKPLCSICVLASLCPAATP